MSSLVAMNFLTPLVNYESDTRERVIEEVEIAW